MNLDMDITKNFGWSFTLHVLNECGDNQANTTSMKCFWKVREMIAKVVTKASIDYWASTNSLCSYKATKLLF